MNKEIKVKKSNISKKLLSTVLREAKIKKKILLISDDFDEDSFATFKKLVDEGNYFYAEESNYLSFDVKHIQSFEHIKNNALKEYGAYLIDYGLVGNDKNNVELIRKMTDDFGIVIWCGGLNGRYNEEAKRLFPNRKYLHDLPECSIEADNVLFALYKAFNPTVHTSQFVARALKILYKKLKNTEDKNNENCSN